ncbi:MAG TPA: hypothetical protein VMX94_06200 [Armatimonadota bacterium]|nr:hypothetical protein [Armatimonadota bacterium]
MTSRRDCGILPAMFWYVMLMLFSPLYLMFGPVFRGEQARLVLALHHQVLILQPQLGKRPSLVPSVRVNHRWNRSQWADIGAYRPIVTREKG